MRREVTNHLGHSRRGFAPLARSLPLLVLGLGTVDGPALAGSSPEAPVEPDDVQLSGAFGESNDRDDLDGLDGLDDLDGLDGLDDLGAGGTSSASMLQLQRGFIGQELRSYPVDRGGPGNDEQLITEVELELELRVVDSLSLRVRPWLFVDALDTELLRYEPLETTLHYEDGWVALSVGQHVESWAVADAFSPLDVYSRRDFATDLFDARHRGELGLTGRLALGGGSVIDQLAVSAYYNPLWRHTPLPTAASRYALDAGPLPVASRAGPEPSGASGALSALRVEHTLDTPIFNADLQYVGVHAPGRLPVFEPEATATGMRLVPRYFGTWLAGVGVRAVPNAAWWSKLTLKAEIAYTRPYELASAPLSATPQDYVQAVVGVDRLVGPFLLDHDELLITVEYLGEYGADDAATLLRPFDSDLAARLGWSAGDFARTRMELRGFADVESGAFLGEATVARQLRFVHEDLRLELSARLISAETGGGELLGLYANDDSLRARLIWDF